MDINEFLKSKKYFLFDLDGTLVDLEDLNYSSFKNTIKKNFNRDFTYEEYLKYFAGVGSKYGFTSYSKDFGNVDDDLENMVKEWQLEYREMKREQLHNNFENTVKLIKGVEAFFNKLKNEGKKIALGTSNSKEFSSYIVERLGLMKYFDAFITVDDVKNTKPNPEIYLTALKRIGGNINEAVIFEDSPNGIQCAKNSGIDYVVVHTEGRNDEAILNEKYVILDYLKLSE